MSEAHQNVAAVLSLTSDIFTQVAIAVFRSTKLIFSGRYEDGFLGSPAPEVISRLGAFGARAYGSRYVASRRDGVVADVGRNRLRDHWQDPEFDVEQSR